MKYLKSFPAIKFFVQSTVVFASTTHKMKLQSSIVRGASENRADAATVTTIPLLPLKGSFFLHQIQT